MAATDGIVARLREGARLESAAARQLEDVLQAFRQALYLPNTDYIEIALGAAAANYLDAEPVWLMLIGPPSGGKTLCLEALLGLPQVYEASVMTEASLLSGTPKREAKGARGGLLREIGDFGVIVCKDFTSILAMYKDARAPLLAALREIYDGAWTRHVGSDGGKTLCWRGKVGLIAAATEAFYGYHSVVAALGERYLPLRLLPASGGDREALAERGACLSVTPEKRSGLREAVRELFAVAPLAGIAETPPEKTQLLIATLANFATLARSAVERDHRHEITNVPSPELPTRLARQLATLRAGLAAIGVSEARICELLPRVAVSCVPPLRVGVLYVLFADGTEADTRSIASRLGRPTNVTRRALEDLACFGLVKRAAEGSGSRGDVYRLTYEAERLCVPAIRLHMQSEVSISTEKDNENG